MVDVSTALSVALTIVGSFIFIALKFFTAKLFKGWKGMIAKAVISLVLSVLCAVTWSICPSLSMILVFAVLIVCDLIGFGVIYLAQNIPFVGGTITYAFSLIAPFVTIWVIIAIIAFLFDVVMAILEIVLLFIPGIGWLIDILVLVVSLIVPIIFPILQIAVSWFVFTAQFSGVSDCILGMGRTEAIPLTGGVHIGATK
ncbi:MAG: hypothetical protein PHC66_04080 [Candidatus Nanoarchaeia archaeon]|nr:hypothetical protein [Candidatus Nanoarchaeia archaeon]MDD5239326.1 hypothetical protein [Candidatus Nanoarchaeia archaeon]